MPAAPDIEQFKLALAVIAGVLSLAGVIALAWAAWLHLYLQRGPHVRTSTPPDPSGADPYRR